MEVKHIALVCRSEAGCDRFFGGLLGLAKTRTKTVPAELARQIFNRDVAYRIVDYVGPAGHFEVFLDPRQAYDDRRAAHVCLAVADLDAFLEKCRALEIHVFQIPKPGGVMTFVRDDTGNLFEIKAAGA